MSTTARCPSRGPTRCCSWGEDVFLAHPLDLSDIVFDAAQYLAEVERATAEHT